MAFLVKRLGLIVALLFVIFTLLLGIKIRGERDVLAIDQPCKTCDIYLKCVDTGISPCSTTLNDCSVDADCSLLPNGYNCSSNSQCRSGYCDGPSGVCKSAPTPT